MSKGFQFTDEQWSEIKREIKAGCRRPTGLGERARYQLETRISEWIAVSPERRREAETACYDVIDAVQLLSEMGHTEGGQILLENAGLDRAWLDRLGLLNMEAHKMLDLETHLLTRTAYRDMLLSKLIMLWESLGGEARTSKRSDNTPDGPLIRFLCKVSAAAGVSPNLSAEMADSVVRKRNRHLKKVLQAKSADDLAAKIRAIVKSS